MTTGRREGAGPVAAPGGDGLSGLLLETKLHTPRRRRALVPRPRLDALLDHVWSATITLVAGPAGFGKTTLLAEWVQRVGDGRCAAWLSLDERDRDPSGFWTYVARSLQAVQPDVGGDALAMLRSPGSAVQPAVDSLLNDLQACSQQVVLVLDDYHLVQSVEVHEGMAFLLDHLPSQAHVVLATRADPPLPLARLRARGDLVEIRAADLRFTPAEAGQYLRDGMGLHLDEGQVAALDQRTEGWIAALQLAALSMQGRTEVAEFIATFAGDDRYIVDYLVEEVLQRQSEPVRQFLLDTSVLHRLTGSLCDAVTGGQDGRATLEMLDRENLFVVPLDERRDWYRYHHLFSDVLRARLIDEHPERVQQLQRRAGAWHAEHGQPDEAVEHALRGQDFVLAADVIEVMLPSLRRDRRESDLRRWLAALPKELIRARPLLTIALVGANMAQGDLDDVDVGLRDAESWLQDHGDVPGALDGPLRTLPSNVAMFRAGQARLLGDVAGTIRHARRAYQLSTESDHLERGAAAALLGLAHWSAAELDDAHRCYTEALGHLSEAGHLSDVLGCTLALSDMEVARGNLDAATRLLEQGLRAARAAAHVPRGTADMHVGLAAVHIERNELDAARAHLDASAELGAHAALPQNAYRSRVAGAQLHLTQHAPQEALVLLEQAVEVYDTDFSPDVRPVPALIARVWIELGRLDEAAHWAQSRNLSADDDLTYEREYEHLTYARLLLARARTGDRGAAAQLGSLLDRLMTAAEQHRRRGSALEALVLSALHAQALKDLPQAHALLRTAVERAEPQRHVRTITEHGPPVLHLLRGLAGDDRTGYAGRLLSSVEAAAAAVAIPHQPLPERLSEREMDVLHLLDSDLDGPEIARHLVVSVNTVRTHTKAIYAKLGVNSRRAAVTRAREIALLPGTTTSSGSRP